MCLTSVLVSRPNLSRGSLQLGEPSDRLTRCHQSRYSQANRLLKGQSNRRLGFIPAHGGGGVNYRGWLGPPPGLSPPNPGALQTTLVRGCPGSLECGSFARFAIAGALHGSVWARNMLVSGKVGGPIAGVERSIIARSGRRPRLCAAVGADSRNCGPGLAAPGAELIPLWRCS